jgi:hypothetical protein
MGHLADMRPRCGQLGGGMVSRGVRVQCAAGRACSAHSALEPPWPCSTGLASGARTAPMSLQMSSGILRFRSCERGVAAGGLLCGCGWTYDGDISFGPNIWAVREQNGLHLRLCVMNVAPATFRFPTCFPMPSGKLRAEREDDGRSLGHLESSKGGERRAGRRGRAAQAMLAG